MKKIGLLYDSVSNNTGDKAIGIVMERFCRESGIDYEVINPLASDKGGNSTLVIGGGHILRDPGDPFYDGFRVVGRHILNGAGLLSVKDMDYLNEYEYVTVRSEAEKKMIEGTVKNVQVVPCVTVLMKGDEAGLPVIHEGFVGVQITSPFIGMCPDGVDIINEMKSFKYFIPVMHYAGDRRFMESLPWHDNHVMLDEFNPGQIFSAIGKMDYVIVCSLHATIFAYVQNVPFLSMYQEKVYDFLKDRGLEGWMFRNSKELVDGIARLDRARPDFSALIEKDKAAAMAHLRKIEDIVKG